MRWKLVKADSRPLEGIRRVLSARRLVQGVCLLAFLILFFYVCWPYGSSQYAQAFRDREVIDAEFFLLLDPLASVSAMIAARMLIWSWAAALGVVLLCMIFPRAFCGYICPLGTLIEGFDWLLGHRAERFAHQRSGWWPNVRYYLLAVVLVGAVFGVLLSGFVAAIPVLTRAMLFLLAPVQTGLWKGWYLVPPVNPGHVLSIWLFALVLGLGLLGRRFWCRHLCPTGALFSVVNMLRLTERGVTGACVKCGKCLQACSFGAVKDDFSTHFLNCTSCRSCRRACPAGAVTFEWRWKGRGNRVTAVGVSPEAIISRRGVLAGLGGAAVAGAGVSIAAGGPDTNPPIRPPGSVPEDRFLQLCVRCGECIKVCPNNVLQPAGFEHGFNGLWTPKVVADWSGCEPNCNNCGQVCPTGAVRALTLEEKRAARIGLAQVDRQTCLPYVGQGACQLCVDECRLAGYDAIEFIRIGGEVDERGEPVEGSGRLAPIVREDRCVGCGLCQMRCHAINVKVKHLLNGSPIRVLAGEGKEDRVVSGSYVALRNERARQRSKSHVEITTPGEYLPDFLK